MARAGKKVQKRILAIMICVLIASLGLTARTGWIQFIDGSELQAKAIEQQTSDKVVNPKRGTIYDRNLKALAVSASVETVIANPTEIKNAGMENIVAVYLSRILDMDYDKVYKILTKKSSYEYVKRKVELEQSQKIKELIADGTVQSILDKYIKAE